MKYFALETIFKNRNFTYLSYLPDWTPTLIFTWYSNVSGKIGTGQKINLSLLEGFHKLTLNVTDIVGVWVEVTTLIIPGYNDDEIQLKEIAGFIKRVGDEIPWHITAFYPAYKLLDVPSTPVESLRKARDIGLNSGLRYVYEGNVPGGGGENTYCHSCGELLIERSGFYIKRNKLVRGRCPKCQARIDGVGL